MAELVKICDAAGRVRGSGFVADDRGTVVTSHEAVDGLTRVLLHGPGRTWLADAADVTALPGLALALVRTDGLGMRPLPVAVREVIDPGTYVRLPARGWRQARVLGCARVTYPAVELAIGTDGRDALLLGGEACGGPVLDARTGAVLAVLGTALQAEHRSAPFAVALRTAAAADPGGPLAALLERNAATVPGYGPDLNLAGALELTATTLGTAFPADACEPVERSGAAAALEAFTDGDSPVLGLVGAPGTGRTTALAALAVRRAHGPRPAPTLWLRGADLHAGDTSLSDAVTRALTRAARIAEAARSPHPAGGLAGRHAAPTEPATPGTGLRTAPEGDGCVPGRSRQGAGGLAGRHAAATQSGMPETGPRTAPEGDGCVPGRSPHPAGGLDGRHAAVPEPATPGTGLRTAPEGDGCVPGRSRQGAGGLA
ncbi:hypothetical protein ACFVFI_02845, partial [Streptomyces sp. NPDC057705]